MKTLNLKKLLITTPIVITLSSLSISAHANWWEQGADLLKGIQETQSTSSSDGKSVPGLPTNL